ncbi:MAG: hypothetical protein CVU38_05370 [Chloroflexi bacterium HGW-Chloroflexi-1]|nr:MAG: hypothetical protein CVU38_05370 [Chloroflexi bacterium HGW-Chloroflexi-1]
MLLAAVSLSCSVGQVLVGRSTSTVPTATKTPRPTFTPLPGAFTPLPTSASAVRGSLPPGVTVVPPTEAAPLAQPGETGRTNLILFATETPAPTPTRVPTDTPGPTPTPTPDVETNRPTRATGPRVLPTPYVVVNSTTLNARRGPGETFDLLGQVKQGDELLVLGRTPEGDWWQVCCIANQPGWVAAELVTARGPVDDVPVLTPAPTPVPTSRPLPTDTPGPLPTPLPPFDIARGPEFPIQRDTGIMTIWVKVYEGSAPYEKPLSGYILKVSHDGVDVSSPEQSFGDAPFDKTAKTEGEREYNLKFEMYDASEADWQIYLAKPDGYRVSPIREFTTKGDSYRNLVVYVAYWLAR